MFCLCARLRVELQVNYDGPTIDVEVVAVGHVDVRLRGARPWHRYEKLRDALQAIEADPRLDTIAPFEYERASRVIEPRDYVRFTTLGPRLESLGVPNKRLVVLEVELEEGVTQQHTKMDTKTGILEARRLASHIVVRAELLYPARNERLGRIIVHGGEDRFLDVPAYDARPTARRLLGEAVARLLSGLEAEDVIRPTAPIGFVPDGQTLHAHLATRDEITRESELYTRFRYFEPEMPFAKFRKLATAPPGVLLGDTLVTSMDGEPVAHTFQWRRRWRRRPPTRLEGPTGPVASPRPQPGAPADH